MAKYKAAKTGNKKPQLSANAMGAIPWLVVIVAILVLAMLLLYGMMSSR